jgi:RNA polymerase sigma-70 factor (ECF subfamily)
LPAPVHEPSPDSVAIAAALGKLPDSQRRALVLYYLADMPVRDVALEMGVPEGTVKASLSRGRAALAGLLRDEWEESNA